MCSSSLSDLRKKGHAGAGERFQQHVAGTQFEPGAAAQNKAISSKWGR
jgi:hypothetical protein